MSYTKNTWKSGDTVTSAKLNNMEEGIAAASGSGSGSNIFIARLVLENDVVHIDKTWQEVYDAINDGSVVFVFNDDSSGDYIDIFV